MAQLGREATVFHRRTDCDCRLRVGAQLAPSSGVATRRIFLHTCPKPPGPCRVCCGTHSRGVHGRIVACFPRWAVTLRIWAYIKRTCLVSHAFRLLQLLRQVARQTVGGISPWVAPRQIVGRFLTGVRLRQIPCQTVGRFLTEVVIRQIPCPTVGEFPTEVVSRQIPRPTVGELLTRVVFRQIPRRGRFPVNPRPDRGRVPDCRRAKNDETNA